MSMKFCKCCESDLNIDDFYKCKSAKDGHQPNCKECTKKCRKYGSCQLNGVGIPEIVDIAGEPLKELKEEITTRLQKLKKKPLDNKETITYKECITEFYKDGKIYKKRTKIFS